MLRKPTTSGSFTVPGAYTESGEEESQSLVGIAVYEEAASTVTFDHDADTFIRDITWTVDGDELCGAFTSGSESISATPRVVPVRRRGGISRAGRRQAPYRSPDTGS